MNYRTCIAAAVIGLFPLAALAGDQNSSDQNPSAGPEGTHITGQASSAPEAELDKDMSTGVKRSDRYERGPGEHETGQASSADEIRASSKPGHGASHAQSGDRQGANEQSTSDSASSAQANEDETDATQANAADNGAAAHEAAASDEAPPKLIVVVPEEMQDQMEDLIAFIQSAPNAQVVVVSQEDQDADQNQDQDQDKDRDRTSSFAFPEEVE